MSDHPLVPIGEMDGRVKQSTDAYLQGLLDGPMDRLLESPDDRADQIYELLSKIDGRLGPMAGSIERTIRNQAEVILALRQELASVRKELALAEETIKNLSEGKAPMPP